MTKLPPQEMMPVTPRQCRAARALLGWTLDELASATGLSKTGLNNFEVGKTAMKVSSIIRIAEALTQAGIELTAQEGVMLVTQKATILDSDNALYDLWHNIDDTVTGTTQDIYILDTASPADISILPPPEFSTLKAKTRVLTTRPMPCDLLPVNHQIPTDNLTTGITQFIYGNIIALRIASSGLVVLITSAKTAEAEKQRFQALWEEAK